MDRLTVHASSLPDSWKWSALFTPLDGFEREWRAWLAQAQQAEESALMAWWAHRRAQGDPDTEGGEALAA